MTERDGSRTLRAPTAVTPRERKGPRDRFTHSIQAGHYKLREHFIGSKVDRRTTGPGLSTPDGLKEGTRLSIIEAPSLLREGSSGTVLELCAPFALGLSSIAYATKQAEGTTWFSSVPDDIIRIFDMMEPDTSEETWLDHTLGLGRYSRGCGHDVLHRLLKTGVLTREQIVEARAATRRSCARWSR